MEKPEKTYFNIIAGGRQRELLWFKERKPGQLLIVQREPLNFGFFSEDPIGDAHFSVHAPDHGSVTTITRKFERILPSGKRLKISGVAHVPETPDGFAITLSGVARCDLSSPRFDTASEPADNVINIGIHDPKRSTLVYCIVVARKPRTLNGMTNKHLRMKSAHTNNYEVGLIYGFQYIPSSTFQATSATVTKSPLIDGHRVGNDQVIITPWSDVKLYNASVRSMHNAMHVNYLQIQPFFEAYRNEPQFIPNKWLRIHRSCRF